MGQLPRVPEMISRRQLLLTVLSSIMLPRAGMAINVANSNTSSDTGGKVDWSVFEARMMKLADAKAGNELDQQAVMTFGMQYLEQLDIHSPAFKQAVGEAFETGNRYWLWQRLIKDRNLNGGILNIDNEQLVQLHDHPGAIGIVRIISGEVEVWQFDEVRKNRADKKIVDGQQGVAELSRVSRAILRPGDTAVLTPDRGNIHALRSVSKECRMLDFFIPPYEISQRNWFEPLTADWFDKEKIACRKIPHHAYTKA